MPQRCRDKLEGCYQPILRDDVFRTIRGRALKWSDKHALPDWEDVFISAVDSEYKADRREKKTRISRSAGCENVPERAPCTAASPYLGPQGWQEWVAREHAGSVIAPGGTHYTTNWKDLTSDHQTFIENNMPTTAADAASS